MGIGHFPGPLGYRANHRLHAELPGVFHGRISANPGHSGVFYMVCNKTGDVID